MPVINWFEIFVTDFDRARTFYQTILQKELTLGTMEGCQMAIFPCDPEAGVDGAITKMDGCQPGAGGTLVYLNVDGDLDGTIDRITAGGGAIFRPRFSIAPHGFIALFTDPEGNLVGLHSMS